MFSNVKELFNLLTPSQRRRFYFLQLLVVFMAIAETAGVAAIGPFMLLIGDINSLHNNPILAWLYQHSQIAEPKTFLISFGLLVFLVLLFGSFISILTTWKLARFSNNVGAEIGSRLYHYYLHQSWLFHAGHNSATLTSKIASDAQRISSNVLSPLMKINARAVLSLFLLCAIILYQPMVGLLSIASLIIGYAIIYRIIRKRLNRSSAVITQENKKRFRLMNEGFGGIKDVLLLQRQEKFTQAFTQSSANLAQKQANIQIFAQAPRFMIELIAFGALIFLSLYFTYTRDNAATNLLASLAVYGVAGFKLIPALQMVYSESTNLKGGIHAFLSIKEDLYSCQQFEQKRHKHPSTEATIKAQHSIELKNLSFTYPNKNTPALNNISLSIPINQTVGFVGASGSGKSTAIDILLGLLQADSGQLLVDGIEINASNAKQWQKNLGYVPQSIFLSDASIRENIAFGLPAQEIDNDKVHRAIQQAHLSPVIDKLSDGIHTAIGERGVQLSGGQRQRIGIARALYYDADILILDEATSALDGITEKLIMEAINDFSGNKTLIMIAHRLATVKHCDKIYFMQEGQIIDSGSFAELIEKNAQFKQMTEHA